MNPLALSLCAALPLLAACAGPQLSPSSAMVAARDPLTGQLRAATPAELRALGAPSLALRLSTGQVRLRADGRRELHLGEAALVHAVLRRDADGRTSMECIEGDGAPIEEAGHADR